MILLAGLLTTGYFGYSAKSDIDLKVQRELASHCETVQLKIEGRLQTHRQVLLGGAALFDASAIVNRNEWRAYAERVEIDQHFNGIQGLGFSLLIAPNRLAQHISEIRRQGFPQYTVFPAGKREVYSSIIYLEPFKDRNLRAFGYDMYSDPVRRIAMEQARDENNISLSGKVTLVQETGKDVQAGTLMYVPVYRKKMPIETVEQRRAAFYGWVYSPFRMADLLHDILRGWDSPLHNYLSLRVYDGLGASENNLLFSSDRKAASSPPALLTLERHLDFNGRKWTLHFELLEGSVSGIDYSKVWIILAGGMSLSILSFFLMLSYLNTRRNAARIADKLTVESRQASRYARSLIEASLDPLVTISTEGKITDVNNATEQATGQSREKLIGTDFSDYFTEPDKAREGYQQGFANGFVTDYPLALRHRDGHVTDVLYNASVYRNEAGTVLGVFAAARDVTEHKRSEDALRNSETRYRLLVESSPFCIHEIGIDGRISSMNKAGLVMMGVAEECKIQGFLYLDAVCDADRERIGELLAKAYAGETNYFEFKASGADGRIFKSCFVPIKNQNGDVEKLMGITEDITERKQVENTLTEKEERLALATFINGVGIWDWNLKTQEMIWDDSMYALYHIRREDFSGTEEAWRASLHPDDLERGDREVADAISGIKPFDTEFRVVWPNGEIHHIKAAAKVFRDDQGSPLRMLGTNMDITDRKRAEDALKEREEFLSLIIENIPDMVFLKDAKELRFVRFNKAGEELLGFSRDELLGKNDYDFFPREQADFFTEKDREVLANGQLYDIPEEPIDSKTGKRILHTKKLPILDANGNLAYLLGISEDITERIQAENEIRELNRDLERRVQERTEELRESEERFRSVASNTPDHLIVQDRELRYTMVINPQLGLTEKDMLGKTDYDFLSREEADKLTKVKRQVLDTGTAIHFETPLRSLSGEEEFFDGSYVPKFKTNGEVDGLIGYFKNITERKRFEQNIRHLNNELQQHAGALEAANKELEAFSYSVSHDLRTPLRAIDGFSRILLDDYTDKLDAEGKRLLNVVRDNAGKMGQLIDDILKFSRAGRLEINFSGIDMEGLVREVYEELRPTAMRELQVEIGHIPPAQGDRAMMRQVIVNLLSNAIKFTRSRESARIEVGSSVEGNETIYFVKDNGAGFDMQYVDRLFGVFQRLHTANEFEGTGIGLAIVKRIINRHCGRVWAEGKVNGGATIYFTLPIREAAS
ncbi:MAG: PAS domain S-box protein [Nitrosomonadales bacterium]|nr:PAS domain S-box protein [Nitrosomonadales bacterium]